MKALSSDWKARLSSGQAALVRLVELTLLNGTVVLLTDSDRDIVVGNSRYIAGGAEVSQIQLQVGTDTQSGTLSVLLGDSGVTTSMIEAGALDGASYVVKVADFELPTLPPIVFYKGFVSKVTYKDRLTADVEGQPLTSRAMPLATDQFSLNCRADLGDAHCKVDIEALKITDVPLLSVVNVQRFTVDNNGTWNNGLAVFTSGVLDGYSFEIANGGGGSIVLKGLMPFLPDIGDTVTLYPGCDKTTGNCNQYNNIVNYQGEPFSISPFTATVQPSTPSVGIVVAGGGTSVATPSTTTTPQKVTVFDPRSLRGDQA